MTEFDADDSQVHMRAELRAHKRERILETATRLFYEGGYRATSMESIADELSATKPFIYYHFKNKYDILEEIAVRVTRMANDALQRALDAGGSARDVLVAMVKNYGRLVIDEQRIIAVFWREESNFHDDTKKKVLDEQQRFRTTLASVLNDGGAQKLFAVEHAELTALSLLNLVTFSYTWYRPNGDVSADTLIEHLVSMSLRLVKAA
jgi:TetR/AcrR family transcriptional regulator, cholesterol catabolism regulator